MNNDRAIIAILLGPKILKSVVRTITQLSTVSPRLLVLDAFLPIDYLVQCVLKVVVFFNSPKMRHAVGMLSFLSCIQSGVKSAGAVGKAGLLANFGQALHVWFANVPDCVKLLRFVLPQLHTTFVFMQCGE